MAEQRKSLPGKRARSSRNRRLVLLARISIWLLVCCALVGVVVATQLGVRRLFFAGNPHFRVKHVPVEVVSGIITPEQVHEDLAITLGQDNIFGADLRVLRQRLLDDPLVRDAEVRRFLPHTLGIRVYGRTPVAQLLRRGGRLVDTDGFIFAPHDDPETRILPVITGIPNEDAYETGSRIDHPGVTKALYFIRYQQSLEQGYWLSLKLIQLQSNDQMRVYLHESQQHRVRDNAVLVIPLETIEGALDKVIYVLNEQAAAGQWTSEIDATYNRVPVKP